MPKTLNTRISIEHKIKKLTELIQRKCEIAYKQGICADVECDDCPLICRVDSFVMEIGTKY